MLEPAPSLDAFVEDPVGRWIAAGTGITYAVSPSFAGTVAWGAPDAAATRAMVRSFEGVWAKTMSGSVDLVMDASRVERIDAGALATLIEWAVKWRHEVRRVVRQQIGVIRDGLPGIVLSGVLPAVGDTHPFRVMRDASEAHRALDPEHGVALWRELEGLVEGVSGLAPEVRALRDLLRLRCSDLVLAEAARALGLSTRSLQRALGAHGTTFQNELREARFTRAHELLTTTDEKVAVIAHAVGITESALAQLIRERVGCTPTELRRTKKETRPAS